MASCLLLHLFKRRDLLCLAGKGLDCNTMTKQEKTKRERLKLRHVENVRRKEDFKFELLGVVFTVITVLLLIIGFYLP